MIIKIIAFLGISFCCFGKIYTLQDVELDFPKAESLKEEVIYSFIYNKNVSQVQDKLKDLKQKKVIDALDFYQYTNLLKSEKEYQEYYLQTKIY